MAVCLFRFASVVGVCFSLRNGRFPLYKTLQEGWFLMDVLKNGITITSE